jgi:creatinine amidohydrolase
MLAIDAHRVDADRVPLAVGPSRPLDELLRTLRRRGVAAVSPSGVLGDATAADADDGGELLDAAVSALVAFVDRWVTAGGA